jgi:hypothetical protein
VYNTPPASLGHSLHLVYLLETLQLLLLDGPLWSRGQILSRCFCSTVFLKGISGREVRALLRGTVCHNRPLVLSECILAPQMPIHFMYSHFVFFALLCRSWSPTLPRYLTHSVSFCSSRHISESFCFSNFHEFSVSIHSLSSRDSSRADCSGAGMVFAQF